MTLQSACINGNDGWRLESGRRHPQDHLEPRAHAITIDHANPPVSYITHDAQAVYAANIFRSTSTHRVIHDALDIIYDVSYIKHDAQAVHEAGGRLLRRVHVVPRWEGVRMRKCCEEHLNADQEALQSSCHIVFAVCLPLLYSISRRQFKIPTIFQAQFPRIQGMPGIQWLCRARDSLSCQSAPSSMSLWLRIAKPRYLLQATGSMKSSRVTSTSGPSLQL